MKLHSVVTEQQYERLLSHFGQDKIDRVAKLITEYSEKWKLEHIELIPYYSVNILFRVVSTVYGEAVLKIHGTVDHYSKREIQMLKQHYPLYCNMYDYGVEDGVLLLECCEGVSLHQIDSLDRRIEVFGSIVRKLHHLSTEKESHENNEININQIHDNERELTADIATDSDIQYPSYKTLLTNLEIWSIEHNANYLLPYIHTAHQYYEEIKQHYPTKYVLHGDLHHDNIIYETDDRFTIVDPKGVLDHYIFELPRFILNELEDEVTSTAPNKIINIINYLSRELNLDTQLLAKAFYIEATLSNVWSIQDCRDEGKVQSYLNNLQYCIHISGQLTGSNV